jgi:hypothetical protein
VKRDVIEETLNNDLIRKFGFSLTMVDKKAALICHGCEQEFRELQEKLQEYVYKEEREFFHTRKGDGQDGKNNGAKNE